MAYSVDMSATAFSFRPEVHGHRGCRGLRPENTLPAFLHALALGVDALELDVVLSQDGQVVVAHEPWLSSALGTGPQGQLLTLESAARYNLHQMPYADIRRCEVGRVPHPRFPEQLAVPTYRPLLAEVLRATEAACAATGRAAVRYAIELKSQSAADGISQPPPRQFLSAVLYELQTAAVLDRVTLLCFDQRILQLARTLVPFVPLCLLAEDSTPAPVLFQWLGFVPDTFGPLYTLLDTELVTELRLLYPMLRLVPWTVNDPAALRQVLSWQVEGITTDYPDRLLNLLGA